MNQELVLEKRLIALRDKHREVDATIQAMMASHTLDEFSIKRMKRDKLRLRDEISYLEKFIYPDVPA